MKYLHLKFENASLKHTDVMTSKDGKTCDCSLRSIESNNWSVPIGIDQISNMLHVMFGLPPKAVNRETIFEINETIYEIAGNSYIKFNNYDENFVKTAKYPSKFEFFQTAKPAFNSHSKISTKIDGQEIDGHYTWNYFKRRFKGKNDLLKQIMTFFEETLNLKNIEKYYHFPEFIEEFHKHLNDDGVKRFFEDCLYEGSEFYGGTVRRIGTPLNKPLVSLLKNEYTKSNGTNTTYNGPTPLLYSKGTGRKITIDGEIIIPLEDEYVNFLEEYGTLPTILDGGLVSVISIRKKPPYIGFENDFIQLSKAEKWRK